MTKKELLEILSDSRAKPDEKAVIENIKRSFLAFPDDIDLGNLVSVKEFQNHGKFESSNKTILDDLMTIDTEVQTLVLNRAKDTSAPEDPSQGRGTERNKKSWKKILAWVAAIALLLLAIGLLVFSFLPIDLEMVERVSIFIVSIISALCSVPCFKISIKIDKSKIFYGSVTIVEDKDISENLKRLETKIDKLGQQNDKNAQKELESLKQKHTLECSPEINPHIEHASWIIPIISALFLVPLIAIPLITHDFNIQTVWGILWIISIVLCILLSIAEFVLIGRYFGNLINTYSVLAFMGWFIELLILFFASISGLISNKRFFLYSLISVPFFVVPLGVAFLIKKKSRVTLKRKLPHIISMFIFMFVFSMPFYSWTQQKYLQAYFNEANIGDGFYYEWVYTNNKDNTLTVHLCFDGGNIVVPSTINGRTVTTIGRAIGADIDGNDVYTVRKITIPNSVTSISSGAFGSCSSLTYIFIPSSVTEMEYNVFYGCNSLTIYCEATSKPSGWDLNWNYNGRNSSIPVVWGAQYKN